MLRLTEARAFPVDDAVRFVPWDLMLKKWFLRAKTPSAQNASSVGHALMNALRKFLNTKWFGDVKWRKTER
jgi:aspartyl/asparaginyl-tRNA synthetase